MTHGSHIVTCQVTSTQSTHHISEWSILEVVWTNDRARTSSEMHI
jgi:hypothetical protein